jgi:glycosyltransferase involved in cell wall biosynthesis
VNLLFASIANPFGARAVGGAETSMRLLAEKMAARGHHVVYLTRDGTDRERDTAARAGVTLRTFSNRFLQRGIPRLGGISATVALARAVRQHRIELIYAFYELPLLEAALRVPRWFGRPRIVMRMAGLKWHLESKTDPRRKRRFERVFRRVDSINFIEPTLIDVVKTNMDDLGMAVEFRHVFVQDVGSCAPVDRSLPYESLPRTPFRLLMAARFSEYQKRQDLIVRALALLPAHLDIRVSMIGNGRRLQEIVTLAEELGVAGRVRFSRFRDQAELWAEMEQTHLLCHATEFEGLAKVVVESMAKGLPVLVSDVPALNGYIRDGETGFLVRNTPEAWAERLAELAGDRDLLCRVSLAGQSHAARNWDADLHAGHYESRFDDILCRARP